MRDISMHLMDIIQNSLRASAKNIEITIVASLINDMLEISVVDDGSGMNKEFVSNVTDPFVTTRKTRKIGLGIPMFKESAKSSGGYFKINSEISEGTSISAGFKISHIDRIPLGDIAETISQVVMSKPETDLKLNLKSDINEYEFDTKEIKKALKDVSIAEIDVIDWIKENIDEGIISTLGGVLNEITG